MLMQVRYYDRNYPILQLQRRSAKKDLISEMGVFNVFMVALLLLAERCNCVAVSDYFHDMLSACLSSVCDTMVL